MPIPYYQGLMFKAPLHEQSEGISEYIGELISSRTFTKDIKHFTWVMYHFANFFFAFDELSMGHKFKSLQHVYYVLCISACRIEEEFNIRTCSLSVRCFYSGLGLF